jgi:hypothetical protein
MRSRRHSYINSCATEIRESQTIEEGWQGRSESPFDVRPVTLMGNPIFIAGPVVQLVHQDEAELKVGTGQPPLLVFNPCQPILFFSTKLLYRPVHHYLLPIR